MRYLSLCSGIEAATVAWAPLGWTPVAFADTDHYCRAFLEHTYPTPYRPRRRRRVLPASDTVRYAALGNSIATTQLEWIGRKLEEVLQCQKNNAPRDGAATSRNSS